MPWAPIEPHRRDLVGLSPRQALPGLATALDEVEMKGYLQAALFTAAGTGYVVERCTPRRPLYVPGDSCLLRYRVEARSTTTGTVLRPVVTGRVFPDEAACAAYMRGKLAPLAARMATRPETAAFATPAAMIRPLNMVVHVWPVDGELPGLVDATDPRRMREILDEALPRALGRPFVVEGCRVELVQYHRRRRCVVRYTVETRAPGGEAVAPLVYGKVTAADVALGNRIVDALRDRVLERAGRHELTVPRAFGSRPDLGLLLLEALPGEARMGAAIGARLRGEPAPGGVPLEAMVEACGRVAAIVHTSGVTLGPARTLDRELAGLQREVELVRLFAPVFGERARSWLETIGGLAARSEPLTLRLAHGDFKHEQVLFDGAGCGLVDFDEVCQAEPALDLGKFVAHLRAAAGMPAGTAVTSAPGGELIERFLRAYLAAADTAVVADERRLRRRTELYEAIALLRLAVRAQQDLDEPRVERLAGLLVQRLSAITAGPRLSRKRRVPRGG